jgi:hypothetical protein
MDTDGIREIFEVNRQVVGDVQVKQTVSVVVAESGGGAPAWVTDACPVGDVGEGAVTVVAVKLVGTDISQVDIGEPVVVEISECNSHPPSAVSQTGFLGHVLERAVPTVPEQCSVEIVSLTEFFHSGSLGNINIHKAVVVEIEGADSTSLGLRYVVFVEGVTVNMGEIQPRAFGDIREVGYPLIEIGVSEREAAEDESPQKGFQAYPPPFAQCDHSIGLIIDR